MITGAAAYAWFQVPGLGVVIGLAMICNLVAAALGGILIPLTLSITQGILWGFLLQALLYTVAGRARDVGLTLWLLAALSAGLLLLGH